MKQAIEKQIFKCPTCGYEGNWRKDFIEYEYGLGIQKEYCKCPKCGEILYRNIINGMYTR